MTGKNKLLFNLVQKAVNASFKNYRLQEAKVKIFTKEFKKLDTKDAIFALTEYTRGLKRELDKHTLVIESPIELSSAEIKTVQKVLHTTYYILHTTYKLNSSLIGGIRLKIGDTILDSSLLNKIDQVKEAIAI